MCRRDALQKRYAAGLEIHARKNALCRWVNLTLTRTDSLRTSSESELFIAEVGIIELPVLARSGKIRMNMQGFIGLSDVWRLDEELLGE